MSGFQLLPFSEGMGVFGLKKNVIFFEKVSEKRVWVIKSFDLVSRTDYLVSRSFDLVSRTNDLVSKSKFRGSGTNFFGTKSNASVSKSDFFGVLVLLIDVLEGVIDGFLEVNGAFSHKIGGVWTTRVIKLFDLVAK